MRNLILCEGKSDVVFLGYYMIHSYGWEWRRKGPQELRFQINDSHRENQSIEWYGRGEDWLAIAAVGGNRNFDGFFNQYIYHAIIDNNSAYSFDRIVVITDHDNNSVDDIEGSIRGISEELLYGIKNQAWSTQEYRNSSGDQL